MLWAFLYYAPDCTHARIGTCSVSVLFLKLVRVLIAELRAYFPLPCRLRRKRVVHLVVDGYNLIVVGDEGGTLGGPGFRLERIL